MKNKITIFQLLFVLFFSTPMIHAQKSIDRIFTKNSTRTISLNYDNLATKSIGVNLPLDLGEYGVYDLDLEQTNLFSDGYIARKAKKNDNSKLPLTFKGTIQGQPNTKVSLTTNDGFLSGFIDTGEEVIWFEPYKNFHTSAVENELIIYYQKDVIDQGHACAANHTDKQTTHIAAQDDQLKSAATGCYVVEMVLVADYGMYEKHGESATETLTHITSVLNNAVNNYDNEFNDPITFTVVDNYIATSESMDKWSNTLYAPDLLNEFRDSDFTDVAYDLASLWVTRDIWNYDMSGVRNDGIIGLAKRPGVCGNRYNLMEDFSSTIAHLGVVFTHEIGHNFGATHDDEGDANIMSSTITLNNTLAWSDKSLEEINSFYPNATCLCASGDKADLTFRSCGSWVLNGDILTVSNVEIQNIGTITTGTNFKIRWYLSTNSTIDASDYPIATQLFSALESNWASMPFGFDKDLTTVGAPDGSYYLIPLIDYENIVTEYSEENNIGCVTPSADLTIPGPGCVMGGAPPEITNMQIHTGCDNGNIGFELTFGNLNPAATYAVFYQTDLTNAETWYPAAPEGINISGTDGTWIDCGADGRDTENLIFYRIEGTCDSDNDGVPDAAERLSFGTDPNEADSDADGILDGAEDSDCDGFTNLEEYTNPYMEGTSFCDDNCEENIVITGNPTQEVYSANATISTSGDVTVSDVNTFRAGEAIELNPGFMADFSSVFLAEISPCVSLRDEPDSEAKTSTTDTGTLLVYPNPTKSEGHVNIEFDINIDRDDAILTIHNINGQMIHNETISVQRGENSKSVLLNNYTSGMYLVSIQAGTYKINSKLIVK